MPVRELGVEGVWWSPRSSKPLRPDSVGLGGFDSHTLPPVRRLLAVVACALLAAAQPLAAQSESGLRSGVERPAAADTAASDARVDEGPRAPITPRRAFFSSFLLPGTGQAKLDRPYAGALFIALEAVSLAMMHRSAEDMRIARGFRNDSMPLRYQVDPATGLVARDSDGNPVVSAWQPSRYTDAWVRTRRLHLEDWTAALIFNHLFAGADAFVAAQLWDLPQKVAIRQTPFGPALAATFSFGRARTR